MPYQQKKKMKTSIPEKMRVFASIIEIAVKRNLFFGNRY